MAELPVDNNFDMQANDPDDDVVQPTGKSLPNKHNYLRYHTY